MACHGAWGLATLLGLGSPAEADSCRLALVLALDVSSSVDQAEYRLQREGLARALVAPEVMRAFLAGGPVALYVFEWAGPSYQITVLPGWQIIASEEDLARVAALLMADPVIGNSHDHSSTAVGAALAYAAVALQAAEGCGSYMVDVAGDGENSGGISPQLAYAHYPLTGVTVNALVVGGTLDSRGQPLNSGDLVAWFHEEVLRGPGAFCILADGYEDYERAMRIKLERELSLPAVSSWPFSDRSLEPFG